MSSKMTAPKVYVLPGVELTPQVLLAKLLGNVENIVHLAVVRLDKDNNIKLSYTTGMDCGDIAIGALLLQSEVTEPDCPHGGRRQSVHRRRGRRLSESPYGARRGRN